jgi:tetratricopeptide (TPR) repeat protein
MDNSTPGMEELLVKYLDGELVGTEKEKMEGRLISDANLRQKLENLQATREAVRLYGLQQRVGNIHQQMMKEMQPPVAKMTSRGMIRFSMAIAAGILLLIGGVFIYNIVNLSSDKVFASNYRSYDLGSMRGDNNELSTLEVAYNEKKFDTVISITFDRPFTTRENFLRAIAFTEMGNDVKAIDVYKEVIASNQKGGTSIMNDESEYYLALTYLRHKDYDKAKQLFVKIKEDPDHLYHTKVTRKLLRQLKMLKRRS